MASYKFNCISNAVPPNTTVLSLANDCPGGSGWVVETDWMQPLTATEGSLLTAAIIGVWLVGWGARQVIRVIRR